MWLMGAFAAIELTLSVIGIYGVMSFLVSQRTRENGIRLALGANGADILRLIVGNGARLITLGVLTGTGAALALQRLIATLLFGVTAADTYRQPRSRSSPSVALFACYLPAALAARVDPLEALRYE